MKIILKITLDLADIVNLKILHGNLKSINIYLKQGYEVRIGDFWTTKILKQTFFAKAFIETKTSYYLSQKV